MPKTDYELKIDDKDVEKSLKDTQDQFDKMGKAGDDAMKKVGKSAEELGDGIRRNVNGRLVDAQGRFVKMGNSGDDAMKKVGKRGRSMGVEIGIAEAKFNLLAGAAIEFGKTAVNAFANVIKSSVQMAATFDATRNKFINIFKGQEGQADAIMDKIGQRAAKLGIDMNEALGAAAGFIPDLEGAEEPIKQLDNLLGAFAGLAQENPEQGIAGARFAIDEAMGGNLRSLRTRFNLTAEEIKLIKQAQAEYGEVIGVIEGINRVLERKGVDVEAASKTLAGAAGQVGFAVSKMQIAMGKPITDQLVGSLGELNEILVENSDDLLLVAGAIGDVIANVVDFISTGVVEYLQDFDVDKVLGVVEAFADLIDKARLVNDLMSETEMNSDFLDDIKWIVDWANELIDRFVKLNTIIGVLGTTGKGIGGALIQASKEEGGTFGERFTKALITITKGNEEATAAILKTNAALEASDKRSKERKAASEDRKKALDVDTEAELANAAAKIRGAGAADEKANALAELGLAEEDLEKIQKDVIKTQEKLVKAEEKFVQERLDIARDFLRERADLELEFSQERADIARQSQQDIAAIETDHRQAIEDQGLELGRDAREMGKKHSTERADNEKDLRRDLLDVEQDYQDELRRIQRTAQQAMEEAERGLDAQAFVAALRQQEVSLEEAAITREGAETDVRTAASERLEDLKEAQAEERATLRQADQDKLEDLQIQLVREFEAQALSDQLAFEQQDIDEQRRLEQQVISEERRLEQQAIDEQRQLEALIQGQAERLAKMVEGLDAETAAVVLAEANKLAAVEDFAGSAQAVLDGLIANVKKKAQKVSAESKEVAPTRPSRPPDKPLVSLTGLGTSPEQPSNKPGLFLPIIQKRGGGRVRRGHLYRVGEAGLEGYIPRRAFGGDTRIGQPTVVGEFGEELFIPPSSGTIIPNNQMGSFLGNTTNMQQSISNTQNNLGGFAVSQSMFEDPIQRMQLENFILDMMSRN